MKEEQEKIPLKTILQNFLNHVETLEAKRSEGEDLYEKEFQSLKAFSDELKTKEDFSSSEGDKEVNRKKNRYKDILPFNYTRVYLSEYPGVPGSDYINANYIKGASGSNAYIASQGPLPHTVNDWWRMVVECEVQVIVMACNEQEAGKHKCECYWTSETEPVEVGEAGPPTKQFGKFTVSLLKSREICPDFLVRTMRLCWTGDSGKQEERTVCQFHYSAWPDHGIPTQVKPLLEMVRLIRDCQASETLPVLIHCSAGCGRTGTICAIDFVWGLLRTGKLSSHFSLYNLVQDMRRQRIAMVQTVDQYMLCHRAVKELFLEQLRVIDSHPYENVGNDGRPLCVGGSQTSLLTPDYETIFVKGQQTGDLEAGVDIEKVLNQRQHLPRMGVNMLSREKESPSTVQASGDLKGENGLEGSEGSESSLPITLEDFKGSQKNTPTGTPKIHEPPKAPENLKESGSQRFKRGDLRLVQVDDGGWKLEQLQLEEKRRSLEAGVSPRNDSFDRPEEVMDEYTTHKSSGLEKPPQGDGRTAKERKKKNSREEKSESQLLRRPSMKKIKAFFDKDKNKENKEISETDVTGENINDSSDFASAVSKLPSLETAGRQTVSLEDQDIHLSGSKSVPSSLDRRQRHRDPDYAQIGSLDARSVEKSSNNNMSKYWPLTKRENKQSTQPVKSVSSERLQVGEKPALPVKRSKSMKSISKPVSVIPIINTSGESSFVRDDFRDDCDQESPYDTYPKSKPRSEELIDLTKRPFDPNDPGPEKEASGTTRFNFDTSSQNQPQAPGKQTYHFGERGSDPRTVQAAVVPPPKPKRDWSSLNHDYANMKISKEPHPIPLNHELQGQSTTAPLDNFEAAHLDKESIRNQLRDFVTVKTRKDGGSSSHMRQGSGESLGQHCKQSSGDSNDKSSEFFEQQMAKLLARKGQDEADGVSINMKRSKSGDIPRPDNLSLVRSVSGELRNNRGLRNSEILDDDARKMLRDCQEYLLGAFDQAEEESKMADGSTESSPLGTLNKSIGGRSVHSSPGNSFNKYGGSSNHLKRSSSGNLNLSPPGTIQKSVSSPTGTIHKSFCSPAAQKLADLSPSPAHNKTVYESEYITSDVSEHGAGSAKQSPLSEHGPSSLESRDYENMESRSRAQNNNNNKNYNNLAVEARGKVSAATNVRNRERRNSFRQAVTDKPPAAVDMYGRPYEQIWFQGQEPEHDIPKGSDAVTAPNIDTRVLADGPLYANASKMAAEKDQQEGARQQLRKSDSGSVVSLRSQSSGGHVRSGSYDNIPIPKPPLPQNVGNAFSMLEPTSVVGHSSSGYEIVNFNSGGGRGQEKKNSLDSIKSSDSAKTTLQSVGLVAEACRDYERSQPVAHSSKQVLTKQHSGGNLRAAPPPYQAPPGPPPPYHPPPASVPLGGPSPLRQHPSPSYPSKQQSEARYPQETTIQGENLSSPKRPPAPVQDYKALGVQPGPRPGHSPFYPSPPGYEPRQLGPGLGPPHPPGPSGLGPSHPLGQVGLGPPHPPGPSPPRGGQTPGISRPNSGGNGRRQARDQIRGDPEDPRSRHPGGAPPTPGGHSRDDSELSRPEDRREARHRKRNSSLVTMTRLGTGQPDFYPQGMPTKGGGVQVVQGARTAVMVGGTVNPPGTIDLDRVAASIANTNVSGGEVVGGGGGVGGGSRLQFGRSFSSVAGVLTGAAQNIKSKITGMTTASSSGGSPSPGTRGVTQVREITTEGPQAIPITVSEIQNRDYGYPLRLDKRPQGPRETPNFQKKQEYL